MHLIPFLSKGVPFPLPEKKYGPMTYRIQKIPKYNKRMN
jgi:hypothetical protein